MDLYSYSETEIIKVFGTRFKEYRLHLNKTQKEIAEQIGVSILTISNFETEKNTNISLKNFLKLLRAIKELDQITSILPEMPVSPKMIVKMQGKIRKRSTQKRGE